MTKIESLTPAQEEALRAHHAEWLDIGTCTERADRPRAEKAITEMYRLIGQEPPRFLWCDSPATSLLGLHVLKQMQPEEDSLWDSLRGSLWDSLRGSLRGSLGDSLRGSLRGSLGDSLRGSLRDSLGGSLRGSLGGSLWGSLRGSLGGSLGEAWWGQHEGNWIAYHLYPELHLGVSYDPKRSDQLHLWEEVARSACWWWPYQGLAVVSERPTEVHMEPWRSGEAGPTLRLHRDDGPALAWADGWAVHAWHGTRVPEWVIADPTPERISQEANIEVRRCGIESYGWDRFVADAELALVGAPEPDPGNPGKDLALYDVPERLWGDPVRLLLAVNGTPERDGTVRRYGITVPQEISTPVEAAAWSYDVSADLYRTIERRT